MARGYNGWTNLTGTNFTNTNTSGPYFTQTTISGATGVLLNPGQTILFTPQFGTGNTSGNAHGHIGELSFYVIPEPTTVALSTLALLGLLRRRRVT